MFQINYLEKNFFFLLRAQVFPNGFLFGNLNNFKNISEFWNVFVVSKHYKENVTEIHSFELITLSGKWICFRIQFLFKKKVFRHTSINQVWSNPRCTYICIYRRNMCMCHIILWMRPRIKVRGSSESVWFCEVWVRLERNYK